MAWSAVSEAARAGGLAQPHAADIAALHDDPLARSRASAPCRTPSYPEPLPQPLPPGLSPWPGLESRLPTRRASKSLDLTAS
jgi:hypothetical protein